jgi:hypothetical protein
VEKLAGCFLGKVVELLLGDPNGSDHVLAETVLLCVADADWQLLWLYASLLLLLLLLLYVPATNSTGVGGCEDSGLGLEGSTGALPCAATMPNDGTLCLC